MGGMERQYSPLSLFLRNMVKFPCNLHSVVTNKNICEVRGDC
jgi:hypothetical protein